MSFSNRLLRVYFNLAYNPFYDFTTARLSRYRELQKKCVEKLQLQDNDKLLCVGLGTGNEICHIMQLNKNISIIGIDFSDTAISKAHKKALKLGKDIKLIKMDARHLEFETGVFDKVLCVHVMDFIKEINEATTEIIRVLKDGGQFVLTYPSGKEDLKLGISLLKDNIRHSGDSGKSRTKAFGAICVQVLAGLVYLPLLLRQDKKFYSRSELEAIIALSKTRSLIVEEDAMYHDFIVYGRK